MKSQGFCQTPQEIMESPMGVQSGKLKPSLRTIPNPYVRFKKQNDLPENYLQIQ
jgi:hypothetical protein